MSFIKIAFVTSFVFFVYSCTSIKPVGQISAEVVITKTEFWIDRFTKPGAKATNGQSWYTITDQGNAGASTITQKISNDTTKCLNYSFELNKGDYKWDPYVSLSLPLMMNQVPISIHPVALAYDFKGAKHNVQLQSSEVSDYAYHSKVTAASNNWTTVVIPFTDLKQASWGKKVEFSKGSVTGLSWTMLGKDGSKGEFSIDNVRLLRILPENNEVLTSPNINNIEVKPSPEVVKSVLPSQVRVADWQGFSDGAYSLTFDDGLLSHYKNAAPILEKYNLKATFFLVSDVLQENLNAQTTWRYGYWEHFKSLCAAGHEIGNHTCTHGHFNQMEIGKINEIGTIKYEINQPLIDFKKHIPSALIKSFAYPFGEFGIESKKEVSLLNIASRGVESGFVGRTPTDWHNIQTSSISYVGLRSLEGDDLKFTELETWIESNTIAKKGWSVYLAHDILPFEEAVAATDTWQPVSKESFEKFAAWLGQKQKANILWIAPFGTVASYIQERNNLNATYVLKGDMIELNVYDNLPNDKFNVPISLEIDVPSSWTDVLIEQNGQLIKPISNSTSKVRFNVLPDNGLVSIKKQ